MKRSKPGMLLIQSLFSYLLILFILWFSVDWLDNIVSMSVNQKRSLIAHKILKEQIAHREQGEIVREMVLSEPFPMEIQITNGRICVHYEDGNQMSRSVCSP